MLRSSLASDTDADGIDDPSDWSSDQVPSWMIAAVSLERRELTPGHPVPVPGPGQDDDLEDN